METKRIMVQFMVIYVFRRKLHVFEKDLTTSLQLDFY